MAVTRDEAREALKAARDAQSRSATLRGYQSAAPHLMLWGVTYALGFTIQYLRPAWNGMHWAVLGSVAGFGDWLIARADRPARGGNGKMILGLTAAFTGFIAGSFAIFQPTDQRQAAAFFPLVVALAYVLFGALGLPRLMWTGVALGVLTLAGFFLLPDVFLLWMAAVGGSALFLGGVWLRRT